MFRVTARSGGRRGALGKPVQLRFSKPRRRKPTGGTGDCYTRTNAIRESRPKEFRPETDDGQWNTRARTHQSLSRRQLVELRRFRRPVYAKDGRWRASLPTLTTTRSLLSCNYFARAVIQVSAGNDITTESCPTFH